MMEFEIETQEDALNALDTRIPLLHSELAQIVEKLWDAAFREGAAQGRQAVVEAQQRERYQPREEYEDPTTRIRRGLEELGKLRGRNAK